MSVAAAFTTIEWCDYAVQAVDIRSDLAKLGRINRHAGKFRKLHGRNPRVFLSSLGDVFDRTWPADRRSELFPEIELATSVHVLLLTRRVGNVRNLIPAGWSSGHWPCHVGLMITVVNQEQADHDVPKLLTLKERLGIPWIGLSIEPLLGPIDLSPWLDRIDWIIVGGESGRQARVMHPDWARSLRNQCATFEKPFLFNHWGEWVPGEFGPAPLIQWQSPYGAPMDKNLLPEMDGDPGWDDGLMLAARGARHCIFRKLGSKRAGRFLDGRTYDAFPVQLEGEG